MDNNPVLLELTQQSWTTSKYPSMIVIYTFSFHLVDITHVNGIELLYSMVCEKLPDEQDIVFNFRIRSLSMDLFIHVNQHLNNKSYTVPVTMEINNQIHNIIYKFRSGEIIFLKSIIDELPNDAHLSYNENSFIDSGKIILYPIKIRTYYSIYYPEIIEKYMRNHIEAILNETNSGMEQIPSINGI